jgi:RNA polymerase sigma factor (sigma-70 family)
MPHADLSDEDLLCACARSRDPQLWETFYHRFRTFLTVVVLRTLQIGGSESARADAQDLVHEIFAKLLNRGALASFESQHPGSACSFLGTVATNHVRDRLRRVRREENRHVTPADEEDDPLASLPELVDSAQTIEHELLLQEIDRELERSGSSTAAQDREIFWFRYRQGMTAREISGISWIKLSVKGVEASLYRTTMLVRRKFGKTGSEENGQ